MAVEYLLLEDGVSRLILEDGSGNLLLESSGATDTGINAGSSISGGTFSRGRWHKLKEQLAAERAAALRARELPRKQRQAMEAATKAAKVAREYAEGSEADAKAEAEQLLLALTRATEARKMADVMRNSQLAIAAAEAMRRALEEQEDDELAAMLLLQ